MLMLLGKLTRQTKGKTHLLLSHVFGCEEDPWSLNTGQDSISCFGCRNRLGSVMSHLSTLIEILQTKPISSLLDRVHETCAKEGSAPLTWAKTSEIQLKMYTRKLSHGIKFLQGGFLMRFSVLTKMLVGLSLSSRSY